MLALRTPRQLDALRRAGEVRFARMAGSSIAAPDAVGWVSDFLNAAYFARPPSARDVDDLRLAFTVLTTRWAQQPHRRLRLTDVRAFHRAFAVHRMRSRPLLTLGREQLLSGGAALLGSWFPAAVEDPERRAHGIAFATREERDAFDPSVRRLHAAIGDLTPPAAPPDSRRWHTYPPVPLPDAAAAVEFLRRPERWPDAAAEGGRFTALTPGGLPGQTFEIEVNARPAPQVPVFTRGYVTCTGVHEPGPGLDAWVTRLNGGVARVAPGDPAPVPADARPLLGVELTTHEGHFLGRAHSRLIAFEDAHGAWIRDVGEWDPLPWYLAGSYAIAGRRAQAAFWAPEPAETSMLAQIAALTAGR
jgi:hypothetical protein